jgi:endonuclease/exonuclease/phosphatase family metal-dependent hydrolase
MTRRLIALAAAALLAACGSSGVSSAGDPVSTSAVDPGNAGGNKLLTVMTRNLYLGGDVFLPFQHPEDPLGYAAIVWNQILTSRPGDRMYAIADEIREARADLVGLQEAYRFVVTPIGATGPVLMDIDFLGSLMQALGETTEDEPPYRLVAVQPQTTLSLPFPTMGVQITMMDHDAILARAGVGVSATDGGSFDAREVTSLAGVTVELTRGWVSVEAKHQGVPFTFVNTHLEGKELGPLQSLQAMELAKQFATADPIVLVGDTNSDPGDPEYAVTIPGLPYPVPTPYTVFTSFPPSYRDAASGVSDTCCFDADLRTGSLYERVDLVLVRGAITPRYASLTGLEQLPWLGDRWPSDHAGVVATVRLENPKFFALK